MKKNGKTLKRVLRSLSKYRFLLALSVLFCAVSVILTLVVPIEVGRAIDLIIGRGNVDINGIIKILAGVLVIAGVTALLQWLINVINNRIAYNTVRDLRGAAFEKIQRLPLSYIDSHGHGDIVSRVIADADQFSEGLILGFTQLFTGVMTILGTLVFMLTIQPWVALIVVILTPLSLFVARFIAKRTYSMFQLQSKTRGEQTAYIDEIIANQKTVKAFSYEQKAAKKFDEINERLGKCSLNATFYSSLVNPSTRFVNNIVYAAVALVGALIVPGAMSVGELVSFLSYANQYTKPFNEISGVVTEFQNALACAGRLFELIDEKPESADSAGVIENAKGQVTIESVDFGYTDEKMLIKNLELNVKSGSHIAIVGPTGCGKTTLINLLMRFYDVKDGAIKIDGCDIRDITRKSLRECYGMVLQDTWIKSATVRENIAMGRPDATDDEIIAAAKATHSHSFIKRLPHGYDTVIGEGGVALSEGQRQLISITRIMLMSPPMLILDEATSSIDTRTEMRIQRAFKKLMSGRTTFIVAHRLSTIRESDVILVMKDGNIIEQGDHDTLIKQGGFYKALWNSQFAKV